jgi:triosephosphate isomerase
MASLLTHSTFVPRAPTSLRARGRAAAARSTVVTPRRGSLQVVAEGTGRFIVGGNWKCNGTKDSVAALVKSLNAGKERGEGGEGEGGLTATLSALH